MKCVSGGCDKRAYYNYKGLKCKFCGDCRKDNMINVVSKKCIDCNLKLPTFNIAGCRPKYCIDCKKDDMINVVNKVCIVCNKRRASFVRNNSDNKSPTHCRKCMPNINYTNAIVKKCITCNLKPARYNIKNVKNKALYCKECAPIYSVDVRRETDMCIMCNSVKATRGHFGIIKYCKTCADLFDPNLKDMKNKKCSECKERRVNPKYSPKCATCYHTNH